MSLNAAGQKVVDAIGEATTKLGTAITTATKAIADLVEKQQGNVQLEDIQPSLDTLNAAADALTKTATDADPAINPSAPPIEVPPSQTPPGETPIP